MLTRFFALILAFFTLTAFSPGGGNDGKRASGDAYVVGKSEQKFEQLFKSGMDMGYFFYEELARKLLPEFKGRPYGSGGAGCPETKTLINLQSFDCVTLVESWWALSYTIYEFQAGKVSPKAPPFEVFAKNLNRIRYFGGENCGIAYRIHYFTQQMEELDRFGLVFNVGMANGFPYKKRINYVSKNSDHFGDFAATSQQKSLETVLNKTPRFYYPKKYREHYYPMAKDGDIIAFASVEPGLDVSHTGIITIEDGKPKLNHASLKYEKVMVGQDLDYYMRNRTKVNGFFVYRPRFD